MISLNMIGLETIGLEITGLDIFGLEMIVNPFKYLHFNLNCRNLNRHVTALKGKLTKHSQLWVLGLTQLKYEFNTELKKTA